MSPSTPRGVLAFDVNETLLDLKALDPLFERVFGDASLRGGWFQAMLQLSFVGGLTGQYVDFTTAQHAAIRMVAQRVGHPLSDADAEAIVGGMRTLPAHPDVPGALDRLAEAGWRMVSLTNSPLDVARDQLTNAGIIDRFEHVLSADEVRQLKPGPKPYHLVAERCGVPIEDVRLVAAHAWDVTGAMAAGARAAFVARPGMVPSPLGAQCDIVGRDIAEVAAALLA
ncbi:MAG: haloacid dehalogenase type II [Dehalococcoidia bacterium]